MDPKDLATRANLAPDEVEALRRLPDDRRLGAVAAAQLYALYLQGYSHREIAAQNPDFGTHALGMVTRAALEFNWEAERDRYTRELMARVQSTVEHATLEGIRYTHDAMAAFQKLSGDKFRTYLKTGDEIDLGQFRGMTIKQWRDIVEMFKAFTEPMVTSASPVPPSAQPLPDARVVEGDAKVVKQPPEMPTDRAPTAEEAASMLEFLAGGKPNE